MKGVHECTFRVEKRNNNLGIGICPAHKITVPAKWIGYGYGYVAEGGKFWHPDGGGRARSFRRGSNWQEKQIAAGWWRFKDGEEVTVTADLDANTISFKRNGVAIGTPQDIVHDTYLFACDMWASGNGVTLVNRK